ncbi:MAG: hypothetical protein P8P83_01720 [Rickettsiaceae bacterium]|nr:hypothetical protein [Rickettsiaceae bacterium]
MNFNFIRYCLGFRNPTVRPQSDDLSELTQDFDSDSDSELSTSSTNNDLPPRLLSEEQVSEITSQLRDPDNSLTELDLSDYRLTDKNRMAFIDVIENNTRLISIISNETGVLFRTTRIYAREYSDDEIDTRASLSPYITLNKLLLRNQALPSLKLICEHGNGTTVASICFDSFYTDLDFYYKNPDLFDNFLEIDTPQVKNQVQSFLSSLPLDMIWEYDLYSFGEGAITLNSCDPDGPPPLLTYSSPPEEVTEYNIQDPEETSDIIGSDFWQCFKVVA